LTEFINWALLIFLNGLPNKEKQSASRIVDLPEPFSPIIRVVLFLSNCISVKLLPVERKFFHLTFSKCII